LSLGSGTDIVYQLSRLVPVFQTIVGPFSALFLNRPLQEVLQTLRTASADNIYQKEIKKVCSPLSYGHEQYNDKGIKAPMRYKNYAPVKRIKCKDYLCDMETVRGKDDEGNAGEYICGFFSSWARLLFAATDRSGLWIMYPDDDCTSEFKALEVSGYGQKIIDQVAKWEDGVE
jgi:hypothetical protein